MRAKMNRAWKMQALKNPPTLFSTFRREVCVYGIVIHYYALDSSPFCSLILCRRSVGTAEFIERRTLYSQSQYTIQ